MRAGLLQSARICRRRDLHGPNHAFERALDDDDSRGPALGFPAGYVQDNLFSEGGTFTGRVPLTMIRLLLSDFDGVDLTDISEIALLFDQTPSGSLFMADLEWVRPPR